MAGTVTKTREKQTISSIYKDYYEKEVNSSRNSKRMYLTEEEAKNIICGKPTFRELDDYGFDFYEE